MGIPGPGAYHAAESAAIQAPSAPAYPFGLRPCLSQSTCALDTPVRLRTGGRSCNNTGVCISFAHLFMYYVASIPWASRPSPAHNAPGGGCACTHHDRASSSCCWQTCCVSLIFNEKPPTNFPAMCFRGQAHTATAPECDGAVGLASGWCATTPAAPPTYPGAYRALNISRTMSHEYYLCNFSHEYMPRHAHDPVKKRLNTCRCDSPGPVYLPCTPRRAARGVCVNMGRRAAAARAKNAHTVRDSWFPGAGGGREALLVRERSIFECLHAFEIVNGWASALCAKWAGRWRQRMPRTFTAGLGLGLNPCLLQKNRLPGGVLAGS